MTFGILGCVGIVSTVHALGHLSPACCAQAAKWFHSESDWSKLDEMWERV